MFGEFIKEKRIALEMTLREFCRKLEEDPSNWSKVERGVNPPPKDENKLKKIAEILNIKEETSDYSLLMDSAKTDAGAIPDYIMADKNLLDSLPIFFRTMGSVKPTKEEIQELIEILKKEGKYSE